MFVRTNRFPWIYAILLLLIILLSYLEECRGDEAPISKSKQLNIDNMAASKSHEHSHHLYQRYYKDDLNWFQSFLWNLLGYASVLIPVFLFVRMVKYSNFNERDGKSGNPTTVNILR